MKYLILTLILLLSQSNSTSLVDSSVSMENSSIYTSNFELKTLDNRFVLTEETTLEQRQAKSVNDGGTLPQVINNQLIFLQDEGERDIGADRQPNYYLRFKIETTITKLNEIALDTVFHLKKTIGGYLLSIPIFQISKWPIITKDINFTATQADGMEIKHIQMVIVNYKLGDREYQLAIGFTMKDDAKNALYEIFKNCNTDIDNLIPDKEETKLRAILKLEGILLDEHYCDVVEGIVAFLVKLRGSDEVEISKKFKCVRVQMKDDLKSLIGFEETGDRVLVKGLSEVLISKVFDFDLTKKLIASMKVLHYIRLQQAYEKVFLTLPKLGKATSYGGFTDVSSKVKEELENGLKYLGLENVGDVIGYRQSLLDEAFSQQHRSIHLRKKKLMFK
jgi:hypothetical protein